MPACLLLIMAASLLAACRPQSSVGQLADEIQTISSWAATARRVGEAWMGGNLPTAYARRTLQTAQQQLQEEIDTISKSDVSPEVRARILEQAQSLKQIFGRMQMSVEQADSASMGQQLGEISSQEQAIGALKQSTSAPPR